MTNTRATTPRLLYRMARLANAAVNKLERGRTTSAISGPLEAIVHVTDNCTFSCAMCMNADRPVEWPAEGVHRPSGEFTAEDLGELLRTWPTLRSICFAGVGEPLIARDIREMVRYAHDRGLRTEMVTNATEVSTHLEWMGSGVLDAVSVSLNAWDAESARRYCGVDERRLAAARAGIEALVDLSARGAGKPELDVSAVLWKSRREDAARIIAFAADAGVPRLSFHNLIPSSLDGCGPDEVLSPEDAPWMADLVALAAGRGVAVSMPEVFDAQGPQGACCSPWRVLYVDAAGGVSGCFRVEAPSPEHGDWRDPATWNNEYFTGLRSSHLRSRRRTPLPERCTHCVEVHGRADAG